MVDPGANASHVLAGLLAVAIRLNSCRQVLEYIESDGFFKAGDKMRIAGIEVVNHHSRGHAEQYLSMASKGPFSFVSIESFEK